MQRRDAFVNSFLRIAILQHEIISAGCGCQNKTVEERKGREHTFPANNVTICEY